MKPLGRSGIMISPLVLGGNTFGWTADRHATSRILDAFIDAGFNTIDTADVYSTWVPGNQGGESETMIGHWLKSHGRRDQIIIASKVGERMPEHGQGLSPEHIVRSVDASLRRLQTDYIDLYQSHVDDRDVPREVTLEAFHKLKQAGKIRAIGASHHEPAGLSEALDTSRRHGVLRYQSIQPRYNLFDRSDYEGELQKLCIDEQVGVLCYSTLAKGFLAGGYRKSQALEPSTWSRMVEQRYLNDRGYRILAALDGVAADLTATVAEVALAWVARQPGVTAPIIGVEDEHQLAALTDFLRFTLSSEHLDRLAAASAPDSGL
jgi:aryl-alcohol dehydrogenase-like predicted oxidoreductase